MNVRTSRAGMLHVSSTRRAGALTRSVNEVARVVIPRTWRSVDHCAMTLTTSLLSLAIGASLLGLVTQIVIPPATWLAVTLLLHASRSMPAGLGTLCLWIAMFGAFVFGNRGMMPVGGAPYFGLQAFYATTLLLPFVIDRLIASRTAGIAATLVFPMAFVAAEFLRARFTPAATWNSLAYTQYGYLPLMRGLGTSTGRPSGYQSCCAERLLRSSSSSAAFASRWHRQITLRCVRSP
jgi:hypothetical protein